MAVDATLTKTERNAVLAGIHHNGLDPTQFEWETIERGRHGYIVYICSCLRHRPTRFYFIFGGYDVAFSPGRLRKVEEKLHHDNWEAKCLELDAWFQRVKDEHDAPDLWAEIGKERLLSDAASSLVENRAFTHSEQAQITTALTEIKQHLFTTSDADERQRRFIEGQFRYLDESQKRLGRKDWLMLLYGSLISIAVALALPPENVRGLLQLANTLLHGLWDGMQRLVQ